MPEEQKINQNQTEELKKILEENLKISQEIKAHTKYIKKYVFWSQIFGVLKILLIVVPLILGFLYLPALLSNTLEPYKELLGVSGQGGQEAGASLLKTFSPELLK